MVGLLLRLDLLLVALLAAADDVEGDLEGLELDPLDVAGVDRMLSRSSSSASIADWEWISAL